MARNNPYPVDGWKWKAAEVLRSKDQARFDALRESDQLNSLVETMERQAMEVYDQVEWSMLRNPDPELNSVQWAHQSMVAAQEAASLELHSLDFEDEASK